MRNDALFLFLNFARCNLLGIECGSVLRGCRVMPRYDESHESLCVGECRPMVSLFVVLTECGSSFPVNSLRCYVLKRLEAGERILRRVLGLVDCDQYSDIDISHQR